MNTTIPPRPITDEEPHTSRWATGLVPMALRLGFQQDAVVLEAVDL